MADNSLSVITDDGEDHPSTELGETNAYRQRC